jgi:hypothetical protein
MTIFSQRSKPMASESKSSRLVVRLAPTDIQNIKNITNVLPHPISMSAYVRDAVVNQIKKDLKLLLTRDDKV